MPSKASIIANVTLSGHELSTGASPRFNLRNVRQCEIDASVVATIPMMIRAVPKRMAPVCKRILSGLGDFCRSPRKNPTMPNPNPAIESVVRIHASEVRSNARLVRRLARETGSRP